MTKTVCDRCGKEVATYTTITVGAFHQTTRSVPYSHQGVMVWPRPPAQTETVYVPFPKSTPVRLDLCAACDEAVTTELLPAFQRSLRKA